MLFVIHACTYHKYTKEVKKNAKRVDIESVWKDFTMIIKVTSLFLHYFVLITRISIAIHTLSGELDMT